MTCSPPGTESKRVRTAAVALGDYLAALCAAKRAAPDDDLVSALIAATYDREQLSDAELLSTVMLLLVAGHETTVNLLAGSTIALLTNPDQLTALRTDPALIEHTIEELLRFDAPVETAVARWAAEDLTLGAVKIPAGAAVRVVLGAANHDPALVSDPDRLNIGRTGVTQHLTFGHGVHYCLVSCA